MLKTVIVHKHGEQVQFQSSQIVQVADNFQARERTTHFFKWADQELVIEEFRKKDLWIFSDIFFSGIALPYTQLNNFLEHLEDASKIEITGSADIYSEILIAWCNSKEISIDNKLEKVRLRNHLKSALVDVLLCIYSLVSVALGVFRRPQAIIWTGDFAMAGSKVKDPRWGELYDELKKRGIPFCEMVRTTVQSPKAIFRNLFRRKLGVFYYQAYWNILSLFFLKKSFKVQSGARADFLLEVFDRYYPSIRALCIIEKIIRVVFLIIRPKVVYSFCITSRSAPMVWAAQSLGIRAVGIMHGMSSKSYMGHEYLFGYKGQPIGNDFYGVWSHFWRDEFVRHSRLFDTNKIMVSGPQKKVPRQIPFQLEGTIPKKVLIISEQELDVEEFMPYFEALKISSYDVTLKIRPFGIDKFSQNLRRLFPQLEIKISAEPLEKVVQDFDMVIGSHSTAVLEATLYGKPCLLFKSKKWGDVFNFHGYNSCLRIFNESPMELKETLETFHKVQSPEKIYKQIRDNYFGKENGTEWLIQFLEEEK